MSNPVEKQNVPTAEQGYDRSDPKLGGILITTVAIIGILLLTGAGVELYYHAYKDRVIQETQLEPVSQDLLDLRKKEDHALHSYGYADKAAGTVRIPVSRAMELVIADAKDGKQKYSTAVYPVKKIEEATGPLVEPATAPSGPGAEAAKAAPAKPAPAKPAH